MTMSMGRIEGACRTRIAGAFSGCLALSPISTHLSIPATCCIIFFNVIIIIMYHDSYQLLIFFAPGILTGSALRYGMAGSSAGHSAQLRYETAGYFWPRRAVLNIWRLTIPVLQPSQGKALRNLRGSAQTAAFLPMDVQMNGRKV